jgi:hypothetical protein
MSSNPFSERTMQMIADFGENRFPCNFGDWQGIGAVSKKGLEAQGIAEPVQLLGHFLMLKKNPVTFEAFLDKAGVVAAAAQSIRAQLQEWCQIHDVRNETECNAEDAKRALAQADLATDETAAWMGMADNCMPCTYPCDACIHAYECRNLCSPH